ncbi:hypothetical protein, partial [Neobacillus sp. 19]|uniref:hypothetical protein n=1 Tax=Neobacillus sp. 19 TaxID=3394458 RepID=UPI003BF738F1
FTGFNHHIFSSTAMWWATTHNSRLCIFLMILDGLNECLEDQLQGFAYSPLLWWRHYVIICDHNLLGLNGLERI